MTEDISIILLNGIGSVGKTSIARALQAITVRPLLHVAMDAFLAMLPEAMFGHVDGLIFDSVQDNGKPAVIIRSGPVVAQTLRGMRHAVAAMAAQGNRLIVDDVLIEPNAWREYCALLANFNVRTVGLFAPLDVVERRERLRGDRVIGLARWQYHRVPRGMTYDLEIDTSASDPLACAIMIKMAFDL